MLSFGAELTRKLFKAGCDTALLMITLEGELSGLGSRLLVFYQSAESCFTETGSFLTATEVRT